MELIAMTKIHAWRVSRQLPNAFLLATGPIGTGNGLAPAEQASCRLQTWRARGAGAKMFQTANRRTGKVAPQVTLRPGDRQCLGRYRLSFPVEIGLSDTARRRRGSLEEQSAADLRAVDSSTI